MYIVNIITGPGLRFFVDSLNKPIMSTIMRSKHIMRL